MMMTACLVVDRSPVGATSAVPKTEPTTFAGELAEVPTMLTCVLSNSNLVLPEIRVTSVACQSTLMRPVSGRSPDSKLTMISLMSTSSEADFASAWNAPFGSVPLMNDAPLGPEMTTKMLSTVPFPFSLVTKTPVEVPAASSVDTALANMLFAGRRVTSAACASDNGTKSEATRAAPEINLINTPLSKLDVQLTRIAC